MAFTAIGAVTSSVAALSTVTVQPALGVEYVLTSVSPKEVYVYGYDADTPGTCYNRAFQTYEGWYSQASSSWITTPNRGILFNNTYYIQLYNGDSGSSRRLSYAGYDVTGMGATGKFRTYSLAAGATATIQPASGKLWILHNVNQGSYVTPGINGQSTTHTVTTARFHMAPKIILTNSWYLTLKNNHGSATLTLDCAITEMDDTALDISGGSQSVAASSNWDIQPSGSEIWRVLATSSDYSSTGFEMKHYDGANETPANTFSLGIYSFAHSAMQLTNALYGRMTNPDAGSPRTAKYIRHRVQ